MLRKLNDIWWVRLPAAATRLSPSLGAIIADGLYLSAIPWLGATLPPLLVLTGVAIGKFHLGFQREEIWTASVPISLLFVAVNTFSTAGGLWLSIGYVVGDFFLLRQAYYSGLLAHPATVTMHVHMPFIIVYVVLALPLILPHLSRAMIILIDARHSMPAAVRFAGTAIVYAVLIQAWTQVSPVLVRPLYVWNGVGPSVNVVRPLQRWGQVIALTALSVSILRSLAERRMMRDSVALVRAMQFYLVFSRSFDDAQSNAHPRSGALLVKVILSTFFLAGLFPSWLDAIVFALLLAAFLWNRPRLVALLGPWFGQLEKFPILVRLAVAVASSYLLNTLIVSTVWQTATTFRPIALSALCTAVIMWLCVPSLSDTPEVRGQPEKRQ